MKLLNIAQNTLFIILTFCVTSLVAMQNTTSPIFFVKNSLDAPEFVIDAYFNNQHIGRARYDISNASNAQLDSMWVDKKYRQKGVGSLLFKKVVQDMKQQGCTQSTWRVIPFDYQHYSKEHVIKFYQKNGGVLLTNQHTAVYPWMMIDLTSSTIPTKTLAPFIFANIIHQ